MPNRKPFNEDDMEDVKMSEGQIDGGPSNIPGIDANPSIPTTPSIDSSAFLDPVLDSPGGLDADLDGEFGVVDSGIDEFEAGPAQMGDGMSWREGKNRRTDEKNIVESISNFLRDPAFLGLPGSKDTKEIQNVANERVEGLYEAFALKFVDSPFYESVTRAFRKIHSYKYLDHPTFKLSMESELKSTGVPTVEIAKALSTVDALVEEFDKKPGERDAGWDQDRLGEIMDMTRNADRRTPKHEDPFNTPLK